MQEQNFEKQVRNKMDELSFVPSAPVWEKVEEQIRKKKERRPFLLWLLPLLLITSGVGWWLISGKDASTLNDDPTKNNDVVLQQKKTGHYPIENDQINKNLNNNTQSPIELNNREQDKINNITEPGNYNQALKENALVIASANKENIKKNIKSKTRYSSEGPVITPINDQTAPSTTLSGASTTPVSEPVILKFHRDSILNSRSLTDMDIPHIAREQEMKQTTKDNKWQLAITTQVGISGISNGIGVFAKSADMVLFDSAPNLSNVPVTGGGFSSAAPPPTPSVPKSGFAFSAGLDAKRKINNRFSILTGLRYAYYSNSVQVGSSVNRDTSFIRTDASMLRTESYFRNDANQHKYANRYHFIQVPVAIEYKLIKKLPLYIQGGFKIEKLLSNNALFYNKYAGVYIKDKEMLANTGLQLFTGFNYHFRNNKTFSFALGPQLQYGTTSLTKKNSNTQQHLYFVGLSTQFFFKKK